MSTTGDSLTALHISTFESFNSTCQHRDAENDSCERNLRSKSFMFDSMQSFLTEIIFLSEYNSIDIGDLYSLTFDFQIDILLDPDGDKRQQSLTWIGSNYFPAHRSCAGREVKHLLLNFRIIHDLFKSYDTFYIEYLLTLKFYTHVVKVLCKLKQSQVEGSRKPRDSKVHNGKK